MKYTNLKLCFLACFLIFGIRSFAQYTQFKINKPHKNLELLEIENDEQCTLVHFKFKNGGYEDSEIYASPKFHIKDLATGRIYKIKDAYNIPISNGEKMVAISKPYQVHYFTLEFERIPNSTSKINIIEMESVNGAFNIYGVELEPTVPSVEEQFGNTLLYGNLGKSSKYNIEDVFIGDRLDASFGNKKSDYDKNIDELLEAHKKAVKHKKAQRRK